MQQITVDEVFSAASRMLEGRKGLSSKLIGRVDGRSGDCARTIDIDHHIE